MAERIPSPRNDDGGPTPPASPGPELIRGIVAVCVKAALSSIPLAAVVFDIGEGIVKFANDRDMQRYLHGLAEMISTLRAQIADIEHRLRNDRHYHDMTRHALLKIGDGTDEAFVADLVNATLNISLLEGDELRRGEIAHAVRQLRPIHVAVLRAIDRFWRKDVGDFQFTAMPAGQGVEPGHRLAVWLEHSVPGFDQEYVISELQALHLLNDSVDDGVFGTQKPYVTAARITQFGQDVLGVLALPPGISSNPSI